jgi:RND superfamily putative drug exporter
MVCVFLSFVLGDQRTLKEFGFVLAVAVFLDAVVVRCMLLPASLELIGPITWSLPRWLDDRLPHINIEGSAVRGLTDAAEPARRGVAPREPAPSMGPGGM